MKTLLILVTVLAVTAMATTPRRTRNGDDNGWGYGDTNGPDTWPDTYPTCGGSRQSPVELLTDEANLINCWELFEFTNYNLVPQAMKVSNTGHSVEVSIDDEASVCGGFLQDEYAFAQFHFHWGATDTRGSEHTVDGNRFPAELHLVHYKKSYGSFSEALKHKGGVAVLAVLLELSSYDNPNLKTIVDSLTEITYPGQSASIIPFPLWFILPTNTYEVYRYEGSLTTPSCNEVVVWTVFKDTIPISSYQLEQFRQLEGEEDSPLQDNFRNLQPLNGRQVYMSLTY